MCQKPDKISIFGALGFVKAPFPFGGTFLGLLPQFLKQKSLASHSLTSLSTLSKW